MTHKALAARRVGPGCRRAALAWALGSALWPWQRAQGGPATTLDPALDLLERPAPRTARGATRRLLAVAAQGGRWIAVGEMGLVLSSSDAGKTWQQAAVPTSVMLNAVVGAAPRHWWAAGHDGVVLHSDDDGQTWRRRFDGRAANEQVLAARQRALDALATSKLDKARLEQAREEAENLLSDAEAAQATGPSLPLFDVAFVDAQRGFVAGAQGQLFATEDAGASWRYIGDRLDNPTGLHLYALRAAATGTLFAAAEAGAVFRSRDAGQSWQRSDVGSKAPLYGVRELSPAHPGVVVAYGLGGRIFRSEDGGQQWRAVESPVTRAVVASALLADGRLVMATQDGQLLHSADGGRTLQTLADRPPMSRLTAIAAAEAAQTLVVAGPQGVASIRLGQQAERKP